jgi:hypothetical protein
MSYCAALELYDALERGRLDRSEFQYTCNVFKSQLQQIDCKKVSWFIDVNRVYAESGSEAELFQWVSLMCEAGVSDIKNRNFHPWLIKGAIQRGTLGVECSPNGLIVTPETGVFAELRTFIHNFSGVGIKVGYTPQESVAKKFMFMNLMATGQKAIPFSTFYDIRSSSGYKFDDKRFEVLVSAAINASGYSYILARSYVSAICRALLNKNNIDIEKATTILANAKKVYGIELVGLILINLILSEDSNLSPELLDNVPRLRKLCEGLNESHLYPMGITDGEAFKRYLMFLRKRNDRKYKTL